MTRHHIVEIVADGRPGGGTTAVLGLSRDLIADGAWDVTIVTNRGSYAAEQARMAGIRVEEVDFFTSRLDWRIGRRLNRIVADIRPDLIHAHGGRAGLPSIGIGDDRVKRVYTVHGYHFLGKRALSRHLAILAERRIARSVDHGIFVSEADRDIAALNAIAFPHASVIYNGIDLTDLEAATSATKDYDLVFSARLHRSKNPLLMLDVMAELAGTGIRLLMIGGGEMEDRVRREASQRGLDGAIDFTGALPRSEAIALIGRARLFMFPSLWEGLPIAPIEALACGIPVIASDIAGTREVVTDGVTGRLIRGYDPRDYAEAIRALLADPQELARLAAQGRIDVDRRFRREQASAAHLALYRRLIG